jgi:nitronate monooxygenase
MGVGVSGWRLARAVSLTGQLGVVSGTALDQILARKLQLGDPEGQLRRAMTYFPDPAMARRIEDAFYLSGGKTQESRFKSTPRFTLDSSRTLIELTVMAAFCEVFLAKEGHDRPVGINLLEKIQLPNIYTIYGAMLAGVDYVLMGAGIPNEIPGMIDRLAKHLDVSLKIAVQGGSAGNNYRLQFDPRGFLPKTPAALKRPQFFPIISSATLGRMLHKKANGTINGFIVETHAAGGHNAPPRVKSAAPGGGEPVYGQRDDIDIEKIKSIGLPFWLAGAWGTPERLRDALSLGADGVQVGTAFAFCEEAGISTPLKQQVIQAILDGDAQVFTDANASPTHFPFKVLRLRDSLSESHEYRSRKRICDLGYMRNPYVRDDGRIGYRCPAEPVKDYVEKGGSAEGGVDKKCLCNALLANIGLGQRRLDGYTEKALITAGKAILTIAGILKNRRCYCAKDVVDWLLKDICVPACLPAI